MYNIVIFGSCVSRDAFSFSIKEDFKIIEYFARSSIGSAFTSSSPFINFNLDKISSQFQRKIVTFDLKKTLYHNFSKYIFDYLVIDLIDERFKLYQNKNNQLLTLSPEFISSKFNINDGTIIKSFTDKHFQLWEEGWNNFLYTLVQTKQTDKLRINKVYWSHKMEGNVPFQDYELEDINLANAYLDKLYNRINEDIPSEQFINVDSSVFIGAHDHKWGISPFHYINDYYLTFIKNFYKYL